MASHGEPVLVDRGVLVVPPGVKHLAEMEERHRDVLWPRPSPGHKRCGRRLRFNDDRTLLHYELFEVRVSRVSRVPAGQAA